jgi:hypothetical protein
MNGVLFSERASCDNKWTGMMSAVFFYQRLIKWQLTFTYLFFESVNANQNNEVKSIRTSCNV